MVEDAAKEVPPADMITEGGTDPAARRSTFTELALILATGLEDPGLETLLTVGARGACPP